LSPNELTINEKKVVGLPCAVFLYNQWNRGEIISEPVDGKIRVYFVDYGTNSLLDASHLKYLFREFAELPRQALRGCLDGIQPAKNSFNYELESTARFYDLVQDKVLWVKVVKIRPTENFYLLAVIDKTGVKDKCINKEMLLLNDVKPITASILVGGEVVRLSFYHEFL
jgi:hypothetical protein